MIIPSIDLMAGRAVQLVGGRELKIDGGDPFAWLERFSVAGETAVIDLDAARGEGSNRETIAALCRRAPCRVGGGIRSLDAAISWLDAGAAKIIIGTAAEPELLRELPRERVIVALDAEDGDVVVDGWRTKTGRSIESRLAELRGLCGGFLVTFVEREGRLGGTDLDRARRIVEAAGEARVTIAGGVTTLEEIAEIDRIGADAQVGMALYSGRLTLGDAVAAPFTSDRADGLVPTVVCDELGAALGLAWSSRESLAQAVNERRGVYESRRRGRWVKGATSGATQELLRVDADCDRDAIRFTVRQQGTGFCHEGTATCWGAATAIGRLESTLAMRRAETGGELGGSVPASYSARLMSDPALLRAKLIEEAGELAGANTAAEVVHEAADVLYFTMVRMGAAGVRLADVEAELARKALRVSRRPGNAKPATRAPAARAGEGA
jgi:phosphoribosyl-ATP pyrophosphohydrolase/phosphoribosyl-AMP cyclohydrolase